MLSTHVTTAAVAVVASSTIDRPLHHHSHRRLRALQTIGYWSGPCPLPLISRLTGRWNPSNHDASPRGRRGHLCVVHGWGTCPNRVALVVESSSWGQEGEAEGEEEEDEEEEEHEIWVLTGLVQGPPTRRTVRKTVSPRGRP
jgi:hypothetical protein